MWSAVSRQALRPLSSLEVFIRHFQHSVSSEDADSVAGYRIPGFAIIKDHSSAGVVSSAQIGCGVPVFGSIGVGGVESGLADYPIQHKTNPQSQKHDQEHCIDVHVSPPMCYVSRFFVKRRLAQSSTQRARCL